MEIKKELSVVFGQVICFKVGYALTSRTKAAARLLLPKHRHLDSHHRSLQLAAAIMVLDRCQTVMLCQGLLPAVAKARPHLQLSTSKTLFGTFKEQA